MEKVLLLLVDFDGLFVGKHTIHIDPMGMLLTIKKTKQQRLPNQGPVGLGPTYLFWKGQEIWSLPLLQIW